MYGAFTGWSEVVGLALNALCVSGLLSTLTTLMTFIRPAFSFFIEEKERKPGNNVIWEGENPLPLPQIL